MPKAALSDLTDGPKSIFYGADCFAAMQNANPEAIRVLMRVAVSLCSGRERGFEDARPEGLDRHQNPIFGSAFKEDKQCRPTSRDGHIEARIEEEKPNHCTPQSPSEGAACFRGNEGSLHSPYIASPGCSSLNHKGILDGGLRPQFVQDLIGSSKTVEPKCNQISHNHLAVKSSAKMMLKPL